MMYYQSSIFNVYIGLLFHLLMEVQASLLYCVKIKINGQRNIRRPGF